MKKFLVKSNINLADEIDIEGFDIFTEEKLQQTIANLKASGEERRSSIIGSNEEVDIEIEDVLSDLEQADEISHEAYMILLNKFGEHFGETLYNLWFRADGKEYDDEENEE